MTYEMQLNKGYVALVNDEDADLEVWEWNASEMRSGLVYATKKRNVDGKKKLIALHSIILERALGRPLFLGYECDHINGNSLDNQRTNLREVTHADNMKNRRIHKNNRSGVTGVYWMTSKEKWAAEIRRNSEKLHLGYFEDMQDAISARKEAELAVFGIYARQTN